MTPLGVSIVQPTIFVALIYIILFGYSLHKNIMLQICYRKSKMSVEIQLFDNNFL